ncbi:unnamed protein product [Jaminaea pallidilutea]
MVARVYLPGLVSIPFALFASPAAAVQLQPDSIFAFVPSLPGNAIVTAFYGLFSAMIFFHIFRHRHWWGLCEAIGAFFSFLGYLLRILLRTNQSSSALYIPMYLFVVLSPACYLAMNYIVYGRLLAAMTGLDRNDKASKKARSPYSPLPPRLYTAVFVISDVVTFLIQAAGGGMQTSRVYATIQTGNKVFLAGVILQMISYIFFTILMAFAHMRLIRDDPSTYGFTLRGLGRRRPALLMLYCLYVSSVCIIIRCIYRVIEMAQGYGGQLYSNELYTFFLDALPLLIAIGIWAFIWPGTFIDRVEPVQGIDRQGSDGTQASLKELDGVGHSQQHVPSNEAA